MVVCITLLFALLGFTSFGDTSCEAYKTQVINDCNSLSDSLQNTRWHIGVIENASRQFLAYTNENNAVQHALQTIYGESVNALGRLDTNLQQVNSIKTTAQSLVCNSSDGGSCDCVEVLGDINTKLGYIQTLVNTISGSNHTDISSKLTQIINRLSSSSSSNSVDLSTIETDLSDIKTNISSILEYSEYIYTFLNEEVLDFFDAFKWFVSWNESGGKSFKDLYYLVGDIGYSITNSSQVSALDRYARYYRFRGNSGNSLSFLYTEPNMAFRMASVYKIAGIKYWLYMFGNEFINQLSSLNNYHWSDYNATGVFTNLVSDGLSSITNTLIEQFSIFSNDSPLKGITEESDKYYDYLTNYYIKVSVNPSGSASEPYTNWFNRIEMLLAALVFKTDKAVSNDFTTANAESMEGSLSGALDNVRGIQDNSQSVITTLEKSSRSLLNVMSQWDDKLTMAASLPSHIEFIDLGGVKDGGGAKRDSSPGVDTKIGIDLSSGPLKLFVDSCRSITTLCWIFVFIFAGWGVARFMVAKFLTIIKLCYVIFKTALGLG